MTLAAGSYDIVINATAADGATLSHTETVVISGASVVVNLGLITHNVTLNNVTPFVQSAPQSVVVDLGLITHNVTLNNVVPFVSGPVILGPFDLVAPANAEYVTPKYLMLVTEARSYVSASNTISVPAGTYTFRNDGTFIPDAPIKDPSSTIDYGVYWTNWLAENETITISSWDIGDDFTAVTASSSDTETAVMISGGIAGTQYTATNRITTSAGRVEERSMLILCENR